MAKTSKLTLQDLTEQELLAKSLELRKQLFDARLQKSTARLEKTHLIRTLRKDIARCETKLTQLRKNNA